MEEILASIRRIISDDDTSKAPAAAPKAATPPAPAPAPLRAEAPRPAPTPPAPPLRSPAAIQSDMAAVLGEPEKPKAASSEPATDLADEDILELTEEMTAPEPEPEVPPPSFRTIDGQPDVFFAETPEPEPEPEPIVAAPVERSPTPPAPAYAVDAPQSGAIMSQAASAAVDSAFNNLAQSVFTQNGRTIEDLVKEMLRPMLKSWLDDNLPGLVERLVRAEIERVSRGR
jgi:cell pole-organizing protein PopZ